MSHVYLIPVFLHPDATNTLPSYILDTIKNCEVIFAENERTARRFLKILDKNIVIDSFEWFTISEEENLKHSFRQKIKENKNIAILSEAGCPGIADPGQTLASIAQAMNVSVKPLVGPSSILLALMASGLNGQQFRFAGYLPIDTVKRTKAIRELEAESANKNCTQIFIETPYRNNQLIVCLIKTCQPTTKLCIAADITADTEWIKTKTIADWKKEKTDLHKRPAIFLLLANG